MVAIRRGQYLAAKLKNEFSQKINEEIEIEESEAISLGLIESSGSIEPTPYEPIIEPTGQQSEENVIWDDNKNYVTFEALEEGVLNFNCNILYKIKRNNENNWSNDYITLENNEDTELLQIGDQIKIKCTQEDILGDNKKFINSTNKLGTTYTIKFNCFGSVDDSFKHSITFESSYIVDASKLILSTSLFYSNMFKDCTFLNIAPELPVTTLKYGCYMDMFKGCTSLTTAPELPATTLANSCYYGMFYGCTSLTTAPELPATRLADDCYDCMFYGCTTLTTAPELPATTLTNSCYKNMFLGCTSLTTAPELPATRLANYCYLSMFEDCTSLTTAPELPATILANSCYMFMFEACRSLTTAPELPATILVESCYEHMFSSCTALNYIKCLATDISASDCLNEWTSWVAASGTFVKDPSMTTLPTGSSGIPTGWNVIDETQ